jgi:hypothetical protein
VYGYGTTILFVSLVMLNLSVKFLFFIIVVVVVVVTIVVATGVVCGGSRCEWWWPLHKLQVGGRT